MRTLFEDTDLRADLEDERTRGKESKSLLVVLWLIALIFLGGTWGTYQWLIKQPAPAPPPPPVSLDDPKQTTETIGKFNRFAKEGNWIEAEKMLSAAATERLSLEQKSLHDSFLGKFKGLKVSEAVTTPSVDRSDHAKLRQDCNFILTDEGMTKTEQMIVPLTLVIDNGRLAIDDWTERKTDEKKKTEAPSKLRFRPV